MEKREYVKGLAKLQNVKGRRGETDESRCNHAANCHLEHNHVTYWVSKNMFNKALWKKHNCTLLWIKNQGNTDQRTRGVKTL